MNDSHINYIAIINANAYTINNINTNANTSSNAIDMSNANISIHINKSIMS